MKNFQFYNPVCILFGQDRIPQLKNHIDKKMKVLLTYGGGSIKKNGVYDAVKESLSGYDLLEFGGIEANPHYETLMKAVEIVRREKVDFLLAVGGGSVLDGTKFIAAATYFEGDAWDICQKAAKVTKAVPLGTILTLPATGSEMNSGAVITHVGNKQKLSFKSDYVFPKFSILDVDATRSLPKIQRANGVVDAFVHVAEQYLTYPSQAPLQDRFSESIFLTLIENGKLYVEQPENMEVAENIVWCSTMALNGLIGCGVPQDWSTHIIGHELTVKYGIDHGQTLALVLPGVLRVMKESKKEKLVQFAERVWSIKIGSDEERIEEAIQCMERFFHSLGIGTHLSDYGLTEENIQYVAEHLRKQNLIKLGERGEVTPEKVVEILDSRKGLSQL